MSAYKGPRAKITVRLAESVNAELTEAANAAGVSNADYLVRIVTTHLTARRRLGTKSQQQTE